jgi:hypothetical protein
MSLTILIHRKLSHVQIIEWFRDPKVNISYATGPLIQKTLDEFRSTGWDWIRRHFEKYARLRVPEQEATAVFAPGGVLGIGPSIWAMERARECPERLRKAGEFIRWHVGEYERILPSVLDT